MIRFYLGKSREGVTYLVRGDWKLTLFLLESARNASFKAEWEHEIIKKLFVSQQVIEINLENQCMQSNIQNPETSTNSRK